jgi:DNA-binding GntR family transcriptional regulator
METGYADIAPITHRTLADAVTARIRDAIVLGRLSPGQRLTESMLADFLEVSRSPVREALTRLRYQGLVEGASTSHVWKPTPADVDEIFSLRTALDCLVNEWIINNEALCEEDIAFLESLIAELQEKVECPETLSRDVVMAADEAFHSFLCHRSGHSRLIRLWQQIMSQRCALMFIGLSDTQLVEVTTAIVAHYRAVLDDLKLGDLDSIRKRDVSANENFARMIKERLAAMDAGHDRNELV